VARAVATTGALVRIDVAWVVLQRYLEVARISGQTSDLAVGNQLNVLVPADLDQFR